MVAGAPLDHLAGVVWMNDSPTPRCPEGLRNRELKTAVDSNGRLLPRFHLDNLGPHSPVAFVGRLPDLDSVFSGKHIHNGLSGVLPSNLMIQVAVFHQAPTPKRGAIAHREAYRARSFGSGVGPPPARADEHKQNQQEEGPLRF